MYAGINNDEDSQGTDSGVEKMDIDDDDHHEEEDKISQGGADMEEVSKKRDRDEEEPTSDSSLRGSKKRTRQKEEVIVDNNSENDDGTAALDALEESAKKARETLASRPFLIPPWVKLRKYQQVGLNWLVSLQSRRLNGILADGTFAIV
jgi:SNF2 family DNA or RNA helicase